MTNQVPPSTNALKAAFSLSTELLENIELNQIPLSQIALKTCRLARLLNDFEHQTIFEFESGGYPTTAEGIQPNIWSILKKAGRIYTQKVKTETKSFGQTESIEQLEQSIISYKTQLSSAADAPSSISSANPAQYVYPKIGNAVERDGLQTKISKAIKLLSSRRSYIYEYILNKNTELAYSGIVSDAFSRMRSTTDDLVGLYVPTSVKKFSAIYDNLESENSEDWANAVHSCRRILQNLADIVFPASDPRTINNGKKERVIKLGKDNYINRIMCFVQDNSKSNNFEKLVGSHLALLGDRLDSIFSAAQKGSHSEISTREEADRYVVFTYMIIGDVLKLFAEIKLNKGK